MPQNWEEHRAPQKTCSSLWNCPSWVQITCFCWHLPPTISDSKFFFRTLNFRVHVFSRFSSTSSNPPSFLVYSGEFRLGAACSVSLLLAHWSLSLSLLAPGAYYYKIMSVCQASSHSLLGAPTLGGGGRAVNSDLKMYV